MKKTVVSTVIIIYTALSGAVGGNELPAWFSWGDQDGINYMTPVTADQGACDACAVFSVCGALEARLKFYLNREINLSEQYIISCWHETPPSSCYSPPVSYILARAQSEGIPEEICFPWQSGDGVIRPCQEACPYADYWRYHIDTCQRYDITFDGGQWLPPATIDELKQMIMDHGPMVMHMILNKTLFEEYTGGVISDNPGAGWGHLVVVYGWHDADSCWLAKNSFGDNWGEMGPWGENGPVTDKSGWFRIYMRILEDNSMSVIWLEPEWSPVAGPELTVPADFNFDLAPDCPVRLTWSCPDEMEYSELLVYDSTSLIIDDIIFDTTSQFVDYIPGAAYEWQVRYHDSDVGISPWSDLHYFGLAPDTDCCIERGDVNDDQLVNISDVTFLIRYLYKNDATPGCCAEADVNNNDQINIIDITALIACLYQDCDSCLVPCTP